MKYREKMTILGLVLLYTLCKPVAAGEINDFSSVITVNKSVSLHVNNTPANTFLKKLGKMAKIDLQVDLPAAEQITLNVEDMPLSEVFNVLATTMPFQFIEENGLIKVTIQQTVQDTVSRSTSKVVQINYSDAKTLADTLNKSLETYDGYNNITFDGRTNSIVLIGTEGFIQEGQGLIEKLDTPRKHQVFKLNNVTADDATGFLLDKVFNESNVDNFAQANSSDSVGSVIKAHIEKNDIVSIYGVKPVVITEPGSNQLLIIGNNYQISLAREVLSQLESNNTVNNNNAVGAIWGVELNTAVKEQIENTNRQLTQKTEQVQSLQTRLQQKNNEIIFLKQQLETLKANPGKVMVTVLPKDFTDLQTKLEAAQKQIATLRENEKNLTIQKEKINFLETQLKGLNDKHKTTEEMLNSKNQLLSSLKTEANVYQEKLQASKMMNTDLSKKNEELLKLVQEKQSSISMMEQEVNDAKNDVMQKRIVRNLKNKLAEQKLALKKVQSQLNEIFNKDVYESPVTISSKSSWFN